MRLIKKYYFKIFQPNLDEDNERMQYGRERSSSQINQYAREKSSSQIIKSEVNIAKQDNSNMLYGRVDPNIQTPNKSYDRRFTDVLYERHGRSSAKYQPKSPSSTYYGNMICDICVNQELCDTKKQQAHLLKLKEQEFMRNANQEAFRNLQDCEQRERQKQLEYNKETQAIIRMQQLEKEKKEAREREE